MIEPLASHGVPRHTYSVFYLNYNLLGVLVSENSARTISLVFSLHSALEAEA
jgi:hypothetical protein